MKESGRGPIEGAFCRWKNQALCADLGLVGSDSVDVGIYFAFNFQTGDARRQKGLFTKLH